ncbi:MAG TPA: DUF3568 family protein [Verrucomicrobiae bacterium]
MKTKIFAAFAGIAIVTAGCVSTVSGTHTAAVPFEKDSVSGRYERTVDQVYQASVQVVQNNGVVITEFIPHDTTNSVRSLLGKVNQGKVWVRVEAVDPKITQVTVQARTQHGGSNLDVAHQLEKEIALQLAR